jgi:hypothetical protein
MPITHPFVSAKADGSDATLVRPSNWNADHSGGFFYVELFGSEFDTPNAGWNTWDISAIVPVGTKIVEVHAKSYGSGGSYILDWGARKYGSSLARILPLGGSAATDGVSATLLCEVSNDRKIDVYQQSVGSDIRYRIIGYVTT